MSLVELVVNRKTKNKNLFPHKPRKLTELREGPEMELKCESKKG